MWLYGKLRVEMSRRFYGMSTHIYQIQISFFFLFFLNYLSVIHKMINSGGCLIDPPGRQPTLSLDRPPEAEDGGSQLTAPEIHSTSGLDDSCQLDTVNTK